MCRPSARILRAVIELMAITLLVACSGGASTTPPPGTLQSTRYSLGGTVSGLSGSGLVLQSNTGEKLAARNGTFTFQTTLTTGTSYYVVVAAQPGTPTQSCSIANGTGAIGAANVADVVVSCEDKTTNMDSVGGVVVGAQGPGLVLQNNRTDNLTVTSSGAFSFPTQLPANSPYSVSVLSPPLDPYQDCIVTNSPGTTGASDVANVVVSCTVNSNPKHTISVTVQSVTGTITLQNNGRDSLTVSSPGTYPFSIQIPTGSPYKVIASAVKGVQSESCTFQNGSGVVGDSDIDVLVNCAPAVVNDPITASVSGLSGTLVLEDNGGDNLSVTQNGPDTFATALPAGTSYTVTIFQQPTNQTCTVSNGSGTAGVTNPAPSVSCVNMVAIGGTVAGLQGSGLVLQDNGGDNLSITANVPFSFPTMIAAGSPYNITVLTQPTKPSQTCTVANATGTAGSSGPAPTVTCTVTISGTVTGLQGSGLVLQDNQLDNLAIKGNGPFGFATPLQPGATYTVSVLTQPTNPAQLCSVANATGAAGSGGPAPVVSCLSYYTISGTVTGYNGDIGGNALILGNSNGDSVSMPENGSYASFTFATSLLSGSNYSITVSQQPGPYTVGSGNKQTSTVCIVSNGSGTITANATNVAVNCVQPAGFAYVTNGGDDSVSAYLVAANGALLSSGPPVSTGHIPSGAAAFIYQPPSGTATNVLPGVSLLYVTNQGSNDLSLYQIDPNTGALTPLSVSGSVYAPTSITLGKSSIITTPGVPPTLTLTAYVTGSTQPGVGSASTPVVYEFTSDASGTVLTPIAGLSPMPSGTAGSLTALQYLSVYSSQGTSGAYYLDTLLTADVMNVYALDSSNGSISPPPPPQPTYNTGSQPTSLDAVGWFGTYDKGNFIYVANSTDGTISLFTQSGFGQIATPGTIQVDGIGGLSSLANDSYQSTYLYATGSRGVWAFNSSTADGSLSVVQGSPFAAGGGPGPITTTQPSYAGIVNPYFSGTLNLVYAVNVTDRTISAFAITLTTGQLVPLTGPAVPTGAGPTSIIVQPRPVYFNGG